MIEGLTPLLSVAEAVKSTTQLLCCVIFAGQPIDGASVSKIVILNVHYDSFPDLSVAVTVTVVKP